MIHLFPKLKKKTLLICAGYIALAGVYVALNRSSNLLFPIIILLVGLIAIVIGQLLTAFNMHNQLLSRLYSQLDVSGFLREYEPFLNLQLKHSLHLMVRLHLSNAYCALGRFDEAQALLTSISVPKGKKPEDELLSRFAIVSNLCYFAEQKEDIGSAQKYLDELLSLKTQLEALQTRKPEKKRMVFNTELNEQCMKYLNTGNADIEVLKTLIQNNSQQLHKITLSLWLARCYLAVNSRREAETLLERIVNLAPDLYPGKMAAQILSSLPGNSKADA